MLFDEPVFNLYCCVTARFGEAENSLFKYFDIHTGHENMKNI